MGSRIRIFKAFYRIAPWGVAAALTAGVWVAERPLARHAAEERARARATLARDQVQALAYRARSFDVPDALAWSARAVAPGAAAGLRVSIQEFKEEPVRFTVEDSSDGRLRAELREILVPERRQGVHVTVEERIPPPFGLVGGLLGDLVFAAIFIVTGFGALGVRALVRGPVAPAASGAAAAAAGSGSGLDILVLLRGFADLMRALRASPPAADTAPRVRENLNRLHALLRSFEEAEGRLGRVEMQYMALALQTAGHPALQRTFPETTRGLRASRAEIGKLRRELLENEKAWESLQRGLDVAPAAEGGAPSPVFPILERLIVQLSQEAARQRSATARAPESRPLPDPLSAAEPAA